MTKKIYIIDWDETIPKQKTGGLVLGSEDNPEEIRRNIREFKKIKNLLNRIHHEEHQVVFIGRRQLRQDQNCNEQLAILYVDVLLGQKNWLRKKRSFLQLEDVYLYSDKTPSQSDVIDDIIIRYNKTPDRYITHNEYKNHVVIVGDNLSYPENIRKRFKFINTNDGKSYLTELEEDLNQSNTQERSKDEHSSFNLKSLWEKYKGKITIAGIISTIVVGGLLALLLAATSVIFPPGGLLGAFLIGAGIGFLTGTVTFGIPFTCSRNGETTITLKSMSNYSPANLSNMLINRVNEVINKDGKNPNEQTFLLIDQIQRNNADKQETVDDGKIIPSYPSPINSRRSNSISKKDNSLEENIQVQISESETMSIGMK